MPLAQILLTDTFSQWLSKDNAMITTVNSLGETGNLLSIITPQNGQLLVWNGSFFVNVTMHGDATLASDGTLSITSGENLTTGQIYFIGCMRQLY